MTSTPALAQPLTLSDQDAADLYSHCRALTITHRGRIPANIDRDDVTQAAAVMAWQMVAEQGVAPRDAARVATYRAVLDSIDAARHAGRQVAFDPTDPDTTRTLDSLQAYSPPRPDALAATTDADRLADILDANADDHAPIIAAALTLDPLDGRAWRLDRPSAAPVLAALGRKSTGRNRAAVAAEIAETFDDLAAVAERVTRWHTTPRTDRAAWTDAARDLAAAERGEHVSGPYRPRDMRTSGPASPALRERSEDALGYPAVLGYGPAERTGYAVLMDGRWHDLAHLTDDHRRILAADLAAVPAHRPTADDRAADDLAYALTPSGPVRASSNRKRKGGGAIGGPVTMRGPRHAWSDKTSR